ncbi:hypothetical protein BH11PSE2_BH11PSE2_08680 [soil metagenome]
MRKHNVDNELAKRNYLAWMKNAAGRDEATLDQAAAAIGAYEAHTRHADFRTFRHQKAVAFKEHLAEQSNSATGEPLSKSTMHSRTRALKTFFEWLSREPGYRNKVRFSDAAYFGLSKNDVRRATGPREQATPSLEQVIRVLEVMPGESVTQRRDRAVVAFVILTGARDSAVASMRLKHVDLAARRVTQDPREVATKGAKTIVSDFFSVGDLPVRIVTDWIGELRVKELFGPDDPIFPASRRGLDAAGLFVTEGLDRVSWTSAAPIRAVFKRAFGAADLPYFPPHSFRRTLTNVAYDLNLSTRELKAWSQCLGHSSMLTTLTSYGALTVDEQGRAMAGITDGLGADADRLAKLADEMASLARRRRG